MTKLKSKINKRLYTGQKRKKEEYADMKNEEKNRTKNSTNECHEYSDF